jgi:hypothetical protein
MCVFESLFFSRKIPIFFVYSIKFCQSSKSSLPDVFVDGDSIPFSLGCGPIESRDCSWVKFIAFVSRCGRQFIDVLSGLLIKFHDIVSGRTWDMSDLKSMGLGLDYFEGIYPGFVVVRSIIFIRFPVRKTDFRESCM